MACHRDEKVLRFKLIECDNLATYETLRRHLPNPSKVFSNFSSLPVGLAKDAAEKVEYYYTYQTQ